MRVRRAVQILPGAVALLATTAAPARGGSPQPIQLSPAIKRAPTELTLDVNPAAMAVGSETPGSLTLALPRGLRLNVRSRTVHCSAARAAAINCPLRSNIGFGHSVVHVAGYLDPGGSTDIVAYIRAFLGEPSAAGDPASLVLEVQLLGVERINQALQENFGVTVPTTTSVVGRVQRINSGPYGLQVTFAGLPGGLSVPSPVTATVTRIKLQLGAVVLKRVSFTRHYRVETMNGPRTLKVHDHRLQPFYLLTNPTHCRRSWPFQIQLGYPSATRTLALKAGCVNARVPLAPPPSPSAPERA